MADYCGTADCILVSRDWTDLTTDGTNNYASDYISEANRWVKATINDWHVPVSPLASGGTVYDTWLRLAEANRAVWSAYNGVMRDKYEAGEDPYWATYMTEARAIMGSLREAHSMMTEDPSIWERGIAPAEGVANGTVSAPYTGILISNTNWGVYTADDEIPRTYVIELDGSGTSIFGQTYRHKCKGGTAWETEDQSITPDTWYHLGYGVEVSFPSEANAAVAVEMMWEVGCVPARGGNFRKSGMSEWSMTIG